MSLIADALNKLKKERINLSDDEIVAPPSLKNAVINKERYKEFVKRTEMVDKDGKKPNIKGFIAVSVLIVVIVIITLYFFLRNEDKKLIDKAGIAGFDGSAVNKNVESLGKPYIPPSKRNNNSGSLNTVSQQAVVSNDVVKSVKVDNNTTSNVKQEVSKPLVQNNTEKSVPVLNDSNSVMPYNNIFFFGLDNNAGSREEKKNLPQKDVKGSGLGINNKISVDKNVKRVSSVNQISNTADSSLYNQYVKVGMEYEKKGDYANAVDNFKKALLINKDTNMVALISKLYIKDNNPNLAFQNIVINGLTDPEQIKIIATSMINSNFLDESRKVLQYANTLDKSNQILFANGFYYLKIKDYKQALKYFNEASNEDSNDVLSYLFAGVSYKNLGNKEEAKKMFEKVLSMDNAGRNVKDTASKYLKEL